MAELKDKIMQRWGIPADKMTLIRNSTVMEDSYCLLDYLISKLGDVRVEINDESKGVEESNSEGYSTTTLGCQMFRHFFGSGSTIIE